MAGISNANPAQIREAQEILGGRLVSVQNQFSPAFRSSGDELRFCGEHGIAFLPWSPLGGMSAAADIGRLHRPFAQVAERHGVSPHQVALAWALAHGEHVIPIPGASRPATIRDSAAAADLVLDADDLDLLEMA